MTAPPNPLGLPLCAAGRRAWYGGRWQVPCPAIGRNLISTDVRRDALSLCDDHFDQVNRAGLITDPYLTAQQLADKYRQRG